jgi:hypothetical protein
MFAGRQAELRNLKVWLTHRTTLQRKLAVISIEGPGGIGKTELLRQALNEISQSGEFAQQAYLQVETQGTNRNNDPAIWVNAIAQSAVSRLSGSVTRSFPEVSRVTRTLQLIRASALEEAERNAASLTSGQKSHLKTLISNGLFLGKKFPGLKRWLPEANDEDIDRTIAALRRLNVFDGTVLRHRILRRSNAIRRDPFGELARAMVMDLNKILKPRKRGFLNLLWVLDDYESVNPAIHEFFIEHLLPELEKGEFNSTIAILGRDGLIDSNVNWPHRFHRMYDGLIIRLDPFSSKDVEELCRAHGITSKDTIDRIFRESDAYPLLVDWAIHELRNDGRGVRATALQNFYDRVTRWMSESERRWFNKIVFLTRVDLSTLKITFPEADTSELRTILEWFKREASIRDSDGDLWMLRPYVQRRIMKLFSIDDPEGTKATIALAGLVWNDPFRDSE